MRKLSRVILLIIFSITFSVNLYSQENVAELLKGDLSNANNLSDFTVLSKAYLEPFGKSFGTSLNNGWYNSAKPHKLFGFDITFTTAITVPPSGSKEFDVSKLNLKYWELDDPDDKLSPTVSGVKDAGPLLRDQATGLVPLTLPKGANMRFVTTPVIHIGVGLPFHTEVMGRFFPKVDIKGIGKFSMWGIGIKNEFKEFIPGFKLVPIDVSILLGYTKFKSSFDINSNQNQTLDFNASGFTSKLLVSKSIPVLTVYAGVGYNKAKTDVSLKGTYTENAISVTDPLSIDFTSSGFSANLGLRIKLALIAFHFDYALGKYAVYNAGVGINFR